MILSLVLVGWATLGLAALLVRMEEEGSAMHRAVTRGLVYEPALIALVACLVLMLGAMALGPIAWALPTGKRG